MTTDAKSAPGGKGSLDAIKQQFLELATACRRICGGPSQRHDDRGALRTRTRPRVESRASYRNVAKYTAFGASDRAAAISACPSPLRSATSKP